MKCLPAALAAVTLAAATLVISQQSLAQAYPNKPIKILVPFVAGGTSDIVARAAGWQGTSPSGATLAARFLVRRRWR